MAVRCDADQRLTAVDRRAAFIQLSRIVMHNGGSLSEITLADCAEAYRAQTGYSSRLHSHWFTLLRAEGIVPADCPPTIHAASRRGQLTVEEIVDGYGIVCRPVRDLLVDYLRERQSGLDYSTIRQLASKLILLFWRDPEIHEPGIDSPHLSDRTARSWKDRLSHVRYDNHLLGQKRQDPCTILLAVRAFYADLSHWALEDPARWGTWAAPSPVDSRDLAGMTKSVKHRQSRMHQRTRELAPLLPRLVDAANSRRAAGAAVPGVIYATDPGGTGVRRNLTLEADKAFWGWACVEVFRHTGVRIEEMLEITRRSFVSYTLTTTGEVITMLQITPSKTDKERLLVTSPELASVFTEIFGRIRDGKEHIPLISRYEQAERLHSPELPFLFQRRWGLKNIPITRERVKDVLGELLVAAKITNTDGTPAHFRPHDFRRIFATEAVSSGLPVHITAKILGHESLATTQSYITVCDQDVIDHHRAFIARRRTTRPSEEYREPTDSGWDEFLGHFEKRKVELGICGRAFGTPCQHEHACVRCPMLRPDTAPLHRLVEMIHNLGDRLSEAREHGWLGEVDGLETSVVAAEQKLAQMRRVNVGAVDLGLPNVKDRISAAHE